MGGAVDIKLESLMFYHGSNVEDHQHDIVEGHMADDQIYNYITQFIQGNINSEQFGVMIKFNYPTHQICFYTEKSLKTLEYVECDY